MATACDVDDNASGCSLPTRGNGARRHADSPRQEEAELEAALPSATPHRHEMSLLTNARCLRFKSRSSCVITIVGCAMLCLVALVVGLAFFFMRDGHHAATDVPGAGYRAGGWDQCGACAEEGAVNINLVGRVCEFKVPGVMGKDLTPARFVVRTWQDGNVNGGACDESALGPTFTIPPGSRLTVLIRNNITQDGWLGDGPLGPDAPKPEDYLFYVQDFGRYAGMTKCSAGKLRMYGKAPPCGPGGNLSSPVPKEKCPPNDLGPHQGFDHVDWENIPGSQEGGFDGLNFHAHGMELIPHMFHPQGTSDPNAPYIRTLPPTHPEHNNRGCYCYKFDVPSDHPQGLYWYHIHAHGSIAVQVWSGMAGLLKVEHPSSGQQAELRALGAKKELLFPIWDPHVEERAPNEGGSPGLHAVAGKVAPAAFLLDQTDQSEVHFLVGAGSQPKMIAGAPEEPVRLRILCATAENLASVEIMDSVTGKTLGDVMWHVASDGIGFEQAYPKEFLIFGGGQREDVVLSLKKPGKYRVAMRRCDFIQFFCTGSKEATLAWIIVKDVDPKPPNKPIKDWRFTPGKPLDDITYEEVRARRYWSFDVMGQREIIPFPKFMVNGNPFDMYRVDEEVRVGDAEEWVLHNPDNTWHPFHVHVAPFLVIETRCDWPYDKNFTDVTGAMQPPVGNEVHEFVENNEPKKRWRDTLLLPPFSTTRILTKFPRKEFIGKTVAHCHFEAHDDTGMTSIIMIKSAQNGNSTRLTAPGGRVTQTKLQDL